MLKETDQIKKKLLAYIGIAYLLLGAGIIFLLSRKITGFAVYTASPGWSSFTSVILILIGVVVLAINRKEANKNVALQEKK